MWIFTRYGFYSAVNARQGDGRKGKPADRNRVMVRVRDIKHAEALQDFIREEFPATSQNHIEVPEIVVSSTTDYKARMFMATTDWAAVLAMLVMDMDYDNFKSATAKEQGRNEYEHALHSVWSVMYRTQEAAHGAGIYSRPTQATSGGSQSAGGSQTELFGDHGSVATADDEEDDEILSLSAAHEALRQDDVAYLKGLSVNELNAVCTALSIGIYDDEADDFNDLIRSVGSGVTSMEQVKEEVEAYRSDDL